MRWEFQKLQFAAYGGLESATCSAKKHLHERGRTRLLQLTEKAECLFPRKYDEFKSGLCARRSHLVREEL